MASISQTGNWLINDSFSPLSNCCSFFLGGQKFVISSSLYRVLNSLERKTLHTFPTEMRQPVPKRGAWIVFSRGQILPVLTFNIHYKSSTRDGKGKNTVGTRDFTPQNNVFSSFLFMFITNFYLGHTRKMLTVAVIQITSMGCHFLKLISNYDFLVPVTIESMECAQHMNMDGFIYCVLQSCHCHGNL